MIFRFPGQVEQKITGMVLPCICLIKSRVYIHLFDVLPATAAARLVRCRACSVGAKNILDRLEEFEQEAR